MPASTRVQSCIGMASSSRPRRGVAAADYTFPWPFFPRGRGRGGAGMAPSVRSHPLSWPCVMAWGRAGRAAVSPPGERARKRFVIVLLWAAVLSAGLWLSGAPAVAADEPKRRATLKGDMGRVASVAFSPDGKTLASADDDWR